MSIKIEIEESPYGDSGTVYQGMLGMVQHWILQLKHFRSQHTEQARIAHIDKDIEGYEILLKSGQESNALAFLKVKQEWIEDSSAREFNDNLEIIAELKKRGLWKERETV